MIKTLVDDGVTLIDEFRLAPLMLVMDVMPLLVSSLIESGITLSWVFVELLAFELSPIGTSSRSEDSPSTVAGMLEVTEKPSWMS